MDNLLLGLSAAVGLDNLLVCLLGVTLGTLVGVLPGLGPLTTLSLLLPLSYQIGNPIASIIFMAGVYYGSQYGGSITSILLRIPGEISSTVTILDGGAMAQKGRAGAALTICALSSFVAGTISAAAMFWLAPHLANIAFLLGPADYASLLLLGILACVAVTQGNLLKGLVMVVLGYLLGLIGTNVSTGQTRFTFDIVHLHEGIPFALLAVGLFGVGEVLYNFYLRNRNKQIQIIRNLGSIYPTKKEYCESIAPTGRGTVFGSLLGLLPGGGPVLASFLSYALEKRIAKNPKQFGKGAVAGLAAPEAANNAASQTSFLPTLLLGLPITPVMAIIVSTLILNGVQPGPNLLSKNAELFWALLASMWIGNTILLILNIPLIKIWIKILHIPRKLIDSMIIIVSFYGAFIIRGEWFDVVLLCIFGIIGFLLKLWKFEPTPLLMSFVIATMAEEYYTRALIISRGNFYTFIENPISLFFLTLAIVCVFMSIFYKKNKKK